MYLGKRVAIVLPAYNAALTLERTYAEIPLDLVDDIILVDDHSKDDTMGVGERLGIKHRIRHEVNKCYGGNQKTCYQTALGIDADIVVMLHPDYQYTPKLIRAMVSIIGEELYPVVFASRILGKGALKGGMPMYKWIANRLLTFGQNVLLNQKLSEYHTGYRAFDAKVLKAINFKANSDDFVFDNQMIAQIFYSGFDIAEVTCPTKYFEEASSINLKRSIQYGLGVIKVSWQYRLAKWGVVTPAYLKA